MRIQNIRESDETIYRCSINHLGIVDSNVAVLEQSELAPKFLSRKIPLRLGMAIPYV